jgi:divalent metal cation (Fe/Co/Zn/Cd) transporter
MTIEAVIAITSGVMANSISLTAFGIDSLIELASAGVLIWGACKKWRARSGLAVRF